LIAIKEGHFQRAIGYIIILNASLVVFLNKIVDGLIAQDPVSGVDVALEDGGTEDDRGIAFGEYGLLDAVDEGTLLFKIAVDQLYLCAWRNGSC
jgi:hypothetical protein